MIFYFTGTGNSLYVAKKIGGDLVSIAQANRQKNQFYQDSVIGFVCPTYAVGIPRIVENFIRNNRFQATYSFAVMTCGGMLGSSLMRFEKLVEPQGLNLDYTNLVVMVDNYGIKNMDKKIKRYSRQKEDIAVQKIVSDIQAKRWSCRQSNSFMVGFTKLMNISSGLCYDDADKHFSVRVDRCIQCGLCQRICPAGNIVLMPTPKFNHKCEGCYACIHSCPQKALSPKRYATETQYRHPEIKLSELLAGNERTKNEA